METNTLVRHKKLKTLGIGCVSKVLKNSLRVNFGLDDTMTTKESQLEIVDVSNTGTITFQEYRSRILDDKSTLEFAILGNELKHFVGIGWITYRVVTEKDLKNYKRVIHE